MPVLVFEASAPGRLDVMGGIADYSGSLVLQTPIRERTTVTLKLRDDFICHVESVTSTGSRLQSEVDFRTFLSNDNIDYAFARQQFKTQKLEWLAYVVGCALVLSKEKNIVFKGADITVKSQVPLGKGVSSSAALEVATMKAFTQAYNLSFERTELPVLAQRVENLIVGAPCGLMDQLASYFGVAHNLLPIVCQPDKIDQPIPVPEDVYFFGIDSGIRHSVGEASYSDVRCAAFMGYSIIVQSLGVTQEQLLQARAANNFSSMPYQGYLCNITTEEFETKYKHILPATISGKAFEEKYRITSDTVTTIKPEGSYAVQQCAAHPVYENSRVQQFKTLLLSLNNNNNQEEILRQMGMLMYASHESYSACGLGTSRTNEIVDWVKETKAPGIFGAKITGGGSGGTVCILAKGESGKKSVKQYHESLCAKYKENLVLFEA